MWGRRGGGECQGRGFPYSLNVGWGLSRGLGWFKLNGMHLDVVLVNEVLYL